MSPTPHPLTAARGRLGWSQAELAKRAGQTRSNVRDLENGRNANPSHALVMSLVAALRAGGLLELMPENLFPTPALPSTSTPPEAV